MTDTDDNQQKPVEQSGGSGRNNGRDPAEQSSTRKAAAPTADDIAPWKPTALNILLGLLSVFLMILVVLTIYPLVFTLEADGFMGSAYLDLLQMDIQQIGLWFVGPLIAVVSGVSLWRAELTSKRRWLIRVAIAGIVFSLLFYIVVVWMERGINLWQYEGAPNRAAFRALAGTFSFRCALVFGGALLGAVGASLPNAFAGGRS